MVSVVVGGCLTGLILILGYLFLDIARAKGLTSRMLADPKSIEKIVFSFWDVGLFDKTFDDLGADGKIWNIAYESGGGWPTIVDIELYSTAKSFLIPQRFAIGATSLLMVIEAVFLPTWLAISIMALLSLKFIPQSEPSSRRSMINLSNLCWLIYKFNEQKPDECKLFVEAHMQFQNLYEAVTQLCGLFSSVHGTSFLRPSMTPASLLNGGNLQIQLRCLSAVRPPAWRPWE